MAQNGKKVKQYDFIFSIGAACMCTHMLRYCDLQIASYPLDWVAGGNFSKRVDMLLSGLERFVELEDLQFGNIGHVHDVYDNTYNGISFYHDFPTGVPLAESWPTVREKYDRRIRRLLHDIEEARSVLVVYQEQPNIPESAENQEIIAAADRLHARYPEKEIDVFYLQYDSSLPPDEYRQETLTPQLFKMVGNYKDRRADAPPWGVNEAFLAPFYQKYRLKQPLSYQIKSWLRHRVKRRLLLLLAKNHPSRATREKLRRQYESTYH